MKNKSRKNLVNLRKNKDLTQEIVALEIELSLKQYQRLEAGTSDGSIKIWRKLKKLLNAPSIDFLLEQEVNNQPDGNPAKENET